METIGARLKALIQDGGHTQKHLAAACDMSQSHLSDLLKGNKDMGKVATSSFMKLCAEVETTPEFLFYGGSENMSGAQTGFEAQLLAFFRSISEEKQGLVFDMLRAAAASQSGNDQEAS